MKQSTEAVALPLEPPSSVLSSSSAVGQEGAMLGWEPPGRRLHRVRDPPGLDWGDVAEGRPGENHLKRHLDEGSSSIHAEGPGGAVRSRVGVAYFFGRGLWRWAGLNG